MSLEKADAALVVLIVRRIVSTTTLKSVSPRTLHGRCLPTATDLLSLSLATPRIV